MTVTDMTDDDVLAVPPDIYNLVIKKSKIERLTVPPTVKWISCCFCGLKSIDFHPDLEMLFCSYNQLTELHITKYLRCVSVRNNKITKITMETPTALKSLDVRENLLTDFDIHLPQRMSCVNIAGNPNIRIKYWDFIFSDPECFEDVCMGDVLSSLDPEHDDYDLRRKYWLWHCVLHGDRYIDVKSLPATNNDIKGDDREQWIPGYEDFR